MGSSCSKGGSAAVSPSPEDAAPAPAQRAPPLGQLPHGYSSRRRGSVSAEPSGGTGSKVKRPARVSIAKPGQSREKIRELVRTTLLFKELDDDQQAAIIDAMFERRVAAGEVVIKEGEEADNFYVIESGRFEATKAQAAAAGSGPGQAGAQQQQQRVALYEGHGSFGELALMYNCPRAATVTALSEGVLWGVQRGTFRSLVVHSMAERRGRYEAVLRGMHVFRHLTQEQLAAVADCLGQEVFEAGEYILWEGAPLDDSAKFYIIESGEVECYKTLEGQKRSVKRLRSSDVFGEVALLTKAPRQADCVAATRCKCLTMSRDAFERLMGPVEQSLAEQIRAYEQSNSNAQAELAAAVASGSALPSARCSEAGTLPLSGRLTDAETTASMRVSDLTGHGAGSVRASDAGAGGEHGHGGAHGAGHKPGRVSDRAGTPPPQPLSSRLGGPVTAGLPGSPRHTLRASDQSNGGQPWRRSHRSTNRSAGSEPGEGFGSPSGSPTAGALAPGHALEGGAAGGAAEGAPEAQEPGSCEASLLPPIEEETADGAAAPADGAAAAPAADEPAAPAAEEGKAEEGKAGAGGRKSPASKGASGGAGKGKAGSAAKHGPAAGKKPAAGSGAGGKKKAGK